MAARLTSLGNVKRGVEVYRLAAKLLLDECPGQAAARAYYQVHSVAQHVALLIGPPLESVRDGARLGKLLHSDVVVVVEHVYKNRLKRGETIPLNTDFNAALNQADSLYKARMEADYRPHLPFSKERASKLLVQAHALTLMLTAEAEFIERNQKQGTFTI